MSADLRARIASGSQAAALLEHPAFVDALQAVDHVVTEQWRAAKTPEAAWEARLRLRALSDVVSYLHAVVADGESAQDAQGATLSGMERILQGESFEDRLRAYREKAQASYAKLDAQDGPAPEPTTEEAQQDAGTDAE